MCCSGELEMLWFNLILFFIQLLIYFQRYLNIHIRPSATIHNLNGLTFELLLNNFVVPKNIHTPPPPFHHWKFLWGRGVVNGKLFKGKYEAKLQFSVHWGMCEGGGGRGGRESNQKFLHVASIAIFWNSTLLIKLTDLIILSVTFYILI